MFIYKLFSCVAITSSSNLQASSEPPGYWPLYITYGQASLLLSLSLFSHSSHQICFFISCLVFLVSDYRNRETWALPSASLTACHLLMEYLYVISISSCSLSKMELPIIFQTLYRTVSKALDHHFFWNIYSSYYR